MATVGRNEPCPCGSGKRYKDCHGSLRVPDGMSGSPGSPGAGDRQGRMLAALEAQRAGRVADATALYQSVLDEVPDNFDALHMLGVVKYGLGELQLAEDLVRRAIAVNPGIAAAHENLRLIQFAQERSSTEAQLCREVEQMRTTHCEVDAAVATTDVRLITFYLPQYHPIPENDRWWGAGFTEWTNVRKASPNFVGHEQPHEPGELGYYDLRSAETRERQASLAREFGIHGFCYYVYWFNGRRLLERPLDEMLASGKPDFPFCVCWANENWTRRWDGLDQDVLIGQDYSAADSVAFIRSMLPVLADPRYVRIDGRPLLLVYKLDLIPHARAMADIWRHEARRHGLGELYLCAAQTTFRSDPSAFGFDSVVEFPPHGFQAYSLNTQMQIINPAFRGMVFNYRDQVIQSLDVKPRDYTTFRCVMPAWDNTARRQDNATTFIRSSPDCFEYWLHAMIEQTRKRLPKGERLVFVNAWNEWGEGCHLEPDQRYGRAYLAAARNALAQSARELPPSVPLDPHRDPGVVLAEYARDATIEIRSFAPTRAALSRAPLVSVVVPVYNHARYLRDALDSVFSQTHSAIELIAVDDGSTDGSFEVLLELCIGAPCPVVLIRQPNTGAPAALNRGVAIARGAYVAILNSDDAFAPTRIESLLVAMQRDGAVLAFSGVEFIGDDGVAVVHHPLADKLQARMDAIHDYPALLYPLTLSNVAISTGNLLFARAVLAETGGFRALNLCHDWDFVLAASYAGPAAYVVEPLYRYRLHQKNTFAAIRLHASEEAEAVYWRFFANIDNHPLLGDKKDRERFLRFAHEHNCRGYFPVPRTWRYRDYAEWVASYGQLTDVERDEVLRAITGFARRPLLSILMPTHNSDERWLRRCLDSVRNQLYQDWELCIVDDASTAPTVRTVLEEYRAQDARIKIAYRNENGHISRATNDALALATGEFAVLLDHDDEITEDALYWVAREVVEFPDSMLIYSDEDKIGETSIRFEPYFKSDWNPELLRSQNCISHLGAFRTDALRAIGGFRPGLEGAQDWDAALRLSERCEPMAIRHIPRVLYHWRATASSTARGMDGKPYASMAQHQAITEHLARTGRIGKLEPILGGNYWRVDYVTRPGLRATVVVDGRGPIAGLSGTLAALANAQDAVVGAVRVIVDSDDAERMAGQRLSSLRGAFASIRVPVSTRLGDAWNVACNDGPDEFIVLLIAGIEGLTRGWRERLLGYAQHADCGVVAPALLLPDGSLHNAGILLDAEMATVRAYHGRPKDDLSLGVRQALAQNLTVPGSECLMFRRELYAAIGGFDDHYSDRDLLAADFCLRARIAGLRNVWTPYVSAVWAGRRTSRWATRNETEIHEFLTRWHDQVACDAAYNPNFAAAGRTFELAFPPRHRQEARDRERLTTEMVKI